MARAPLAAGRKLTFADVLAALRHRGRDADADHYEAAFLARLCPPLDPAQVLALPFDDLCTATRLLTGSSSFSRDEATNLDPSLASGQTVAGSDFRYGTWYLEQMGGHRRRATS